MREIVTILCTNTLPHSVVYLISLSSNNLIQMYYLLWFEPKYYSDPIKKKRFTCSLETNKLVAKSCCCESTLI